MILSSNPKLQIRQIFDDSSSTNILKLKITKNIIPENLSLTGGAMSSKFYFIHLENDVFIKSENLRLMELLFDFLIEHKSSYAKETNESINVVLKKKNPEVFI